MSVDFIINKFKNNTGPNRYITIYNFNSSDNQLLLEALKSGNYKVYFNDDGVIEIKKGAETIKKFKNSVTGNNSIDITTSNQVKMKDYTQKYVFSRPWGAYLLYIDNQKIKILYNPIPRELANTVTSANRKSYNDYIIDVCFDTDKLDPVCYCIHRDNDEHKDDPNSTEFCMDNLLGPELNKLAKRNQGAGGYIGPQCHCYNPRCDESHPYRVNAIIKLSPPGITACPTSKNITICNASFDAGQIETGDVSVQQKCGGAGDIDASLPSTSPSKPVTGSTYTSDKPPSSTTPTTTSSTTSISPTSTTPTKTSSTTSSIVPPKKKVPVPIQTNNTLYIVIFIVVILIAIISYFMLKSPSQRFYKRHF
jgi:hypothetical protein